MAVRPRTVRPRRGSGSVAPRAMYAGRKLCDHSAEAATSSCTHADNAPHAAFHDITTTTRQPSGAAAAAAAPAAPHQSLRRRGGCARVCWQCVRTMRASLVHREEETDAAGLAPPLATNNNARRPSRAFCFCAWDCCDATDDAATLEGRREAFRETIWRK